MKLNLIISLFAAALLGSGVANAAGTLKASEYTDGQIALGSQGDFDTLVVNEPLTLTGGMGSLWLSKGATIEFLADNSGAICSISTSKTLFSSANSVYFNYRGDVYDIRFNADAQSVVAASAGTPITLIRDLNEGCKGFFYPSKDLSKTTLTLNGVGYNQTVEMGGVQFTYVGPKESDYTFKAGEIGFTGYEGGSHALKLVANGKPTPEPTTGTLSLLALVALAARRRKH